MSDFCSSNRDKRNWLIQEARKLNQPHQGVQIQVDKFGLSHLLQLVN